MTAIQIGPCNVSATPAALARGQVLGLRVQATTIRGAPTSYVDQGTGSPIVLLHGAPLTSLGFVRVIHELSRHHRVIAPDLPGFGGSEQPDGFGGTLQEYATFVVAFCEALELSGFVLYVNDASGSIGIAAAARMERFVSGLVVADTVPIPLTGLAAFVRFGLRYLVTSRVVRFLNRRFNLFPWIVATVAPWLKPFGRDERRALLNEFDTVAKRERVLDLFEQMGTDDVFMRATAFLAARHLAHKPALILCGQFDPMRAVGGVKRFRRMFPNSAVAIVPREEHFPILASGDAVGRIVHDWIARAVPLITASTLRAADA